MNKEELKLAMKAADEATMERIVDEWYDSTFAYELRKYLGDKVYESIPDEMWDECHEEGFE